MTTATHTPSDTSAGMPPPIPADLLPASASPEKAQVEMINDAVVIGDLSSPEVVQLLDQTTVYGVTRGAPLVCGDDWSQLQTTWREAIVGVLTRHPEQADKGGNAFFFGEGELTGKRHNGIPLCYKMKGRLRRIFAVQIDVDGGATVDDVVRRVRAFGVLAVIYTTHSNAKKGGPGSERFRVVIPLAEPFDLRPDPKGRRDWGPDYAEWCARYVGLIEAIIPKGADWDASAMRPSQLMYAPARPKGAAFKHYVIAGVGLDLSTIPPGDASKYAKERPAYNGERGSAHFSAGPAVLSDGFNLSDWWRAVGKNFLLESFLDYVGWDVGGRSGDGFDMLCPNAAEHSPDGGDIAWGVDGPDSEHGAVVFCHHDHCKMLRPVDYVRLIEEQVSGFPDEHESLSDVLSCDFLYDDDAEAVSKYDFGVLRPVVRLATADAVATAWEAVGEMDDNARAALCAGVILAKNKDSARNKLDTLMGGNARQRAENWKAGVGHLAKWLASQKVKPVSEADGEFKISLDPSDPLGETPTQKLETLSARFRLVNYKGKTLVIRNVDRVGIEMGDGILEFWTKDSLRQFYAHEAWPEGEGKDMKWINPVNRWWASDAKRHSRVVFDPSDRDRPNDVNLYDADKRRLLPMSGDARPITNFIRDIICDGDVAVYDWVILWLAHLVQRPWERPGTAIVMYGKGGAGKGTLGQIVRRLVEPYDMLATDPNHLVGQFAGPAIATSLVVVSEEAVYAKNPETADKLKGMITQRDMLVEAKGVQAVQMDVFFRVIIDSNHDCAVRIEGNNSERRYLVLNVSSAMVGKDSEFAELYSHINGPAMQAFMHDLMQYSPADAGGWNTVRTAPSTVHRKQMFVESLRASDKAMLRMLEDGEFIWRDGAHTFRIVLGDGENRVPARACDDWVRSFAGRYDADMRPAAAVWKRLFGVELDRPKGARVTGDRQTFDEGAADAEYAWQPFGFNTSMYHLPSLATIRDMISDRTGRETDGAELADGAN